MKQTILLTGATGFLGKILQSCLEKSGFNLITLGQRSTNKYQINLCEDFKLNNQDQIDIVIHAAGKAHTVPTTHEERQSFYDVNLKGTVNLCNALDKLDKKPKSFIFISTVAVYGVDSGMEISEAHALNGTTPYAHSKILAEKWLIEWAQEKNIAMSILRLPLIVGPNPPGNLGSMINGIKSGRYLSIGKADARKSMVWAEDIASIIPNLLITGGIYNLTDGHNPTFKELERTISLAYGKNVPLAIPLYFANIIAKFGNVITRFPVNTDKLHKITSSLTFDDTKARKMLSWKPNFVIEQLRDTL